MTNRAILLSSVGDSKHLCWLIHQPIQLVLAICRRRGGSSWKSFLSTPPPLNSPLSNLFCPRFLIISTSKLTFVKSIMITIIIVMIAIMLIITMIKIIVVVDDQTSQSKTLLCHQHTMLAICLYPHDDDVDGFLHCSLSLSLSLPRKSSDQAACDPGSETVSHKRQFSSLASSGRVPAFITGATRCAALYYISLYLIVYHKVYVSSELPGVPPIIRAPMMETNCQVLLYDAQCITLIIDRGQHIRDYCFESFKWRET